MLEAHESSMSTDLFLLNQQQSALSVPVGGTSVYLLFFPPPFGGRLFLLCCMALSLLSA